MPGTDSPRTYEIERGVVPQRLIDDALRLINLDLLEQGPSSETLSRWLWATHWFPHLNWHESITRLVEPLPAKWQTGQMCDPQILLQFPHTGPRPRISFHVDQEPEWAQGRRYLRIVGIPLSPWRHENGGLLTQIDGSTVPVEVDPTDVVAMSPDLPHSGGVNMTGAIRYAVYFRWLAES